MDKATTYSKGDKVTVNGKTAVIESPIYEIVDNKTTDNIYCYAAIIDGTGHIIRPDEIDDTEVEDKLKTAMEEECFTLVDDYDDPKITLFGKSKIGESGKDGKRVENFQYCIGESWKDGENFSIHHIHTWNGVVKWLDEHTQGYEFYKQLYEDRLLNNRGES